LIDALRHLRLTSFRAALRADLLRAGSGAFPLVRASAIGLFSRLPFLRRQGADRQQHRDGRENSNSMLPIHSDSPIFRVQEGDFGAGYTRGQQSRGKGCKKRSRTGERRWRRSLPNSKWKGTPGENAPELFPKMHPLRLRSPNLTSLKPRWQAHGQ
jgi:hypothetical protein